MITGYSPFHGEDEEELFHAIKNNNVYFPKTLSESSISIIRMLLEKDPLKRLGSETSSYGSIRQHAFFSHIDWVKLASRQIQPPFVPKCVCAQIIFEQLYKLGMYLKNFLLQRNRLMTFPILIRTLPTSCRGFPKSTANSSRQSMKRFLRDSVLLIGILEFNRVHI